MNDCHSWTLSHVVLVGSYSEHWCISGPVQRWGWPWRLPERLCNHLLRLPLLPPGGVVQPAPELERQPPERHKDQLQQSWRDLLDGVLDAICRERGQETLWRWHIQTVAVVQLSRGGRWCGRLGLPGSHRQGGSRTLRSEVPPDCVRFIGPCRVDGCTRRGVCA